MTDQLAFRLGIIEKDQEFIGKILSSPELSERQQIEEVRKLLNPRELTRYDAGHSLIDSLADVEVDTRPRELNFADAEGIPSVSADEIKEWLQRQKGLRVYGSFVEWLHSEDAERPGDVDIATEYPKEHAEELAEVLRESSGAEVEVKFEPTHEGYQIKVNGRTAVDIHSMDSYKAVMPYRWGSKSARMIEGIPFERIGEQILRRGVTVLNPGVGIDGRGLIGPEASATPWREKDIKKMKVAADVLIAAAEEQGCETLVRKAKANLRALLTEPVRAFPEVGGRELEHPTYVPEYDYGRKRRPKVKSRKRTKSISLPLSPGLAKLRMERRDY